MIVKKSRQAVQAMAIALSFLGIVACSQQNISSEQSIPANAGSVEATVFQCIQNSSVWVTIAKRGNAVSSSPLVTWNSTEFGEQWTPQKRCNLVSSKLTKVVEKNKGRLGELNLTTGKLDSNQTVVCVLSSGQESCNRDNMLFTLNKKNAKNPSAVLVEITNFSQGLASNSTVAEGGSVPQYIALETLVNRSFGQTGKSRW